MRGCCGRSKNSWAAACSSTTPSARKHTRSALLRVIYGRVAVDAGVIKLGGPPGIEITAVDVDLDQVRQQVGIMFQQDNQFPTAVPERRIRATG